MLLSDWSLDFRINKTMYIYSLRNCLKTEGFFANQIGSLVHQRNETTSQSLDSRSPAVNLAAKFDCALCERTLKSSIILFFTILLIFSNF